MILYLCERLHGEATVLQHFVLVGEIRKLEKGLFDLYIVQIRER